MNENDLRVQRTRSLLRQALIDLVSSEGYENISVRDIAQKAQVGYKTFYRHYEGKEALLQALANEWVAEFRQVVLPPSDERASEENTLAILNYIEAKAPLFLMLLNSSAANQILDVATSFGLEEGRQTFYSPHIPHELMAHHFASSIINCLRWWLESGMACSKEEMAEYINLLLIFPLKQLSDPNSEQKKESGIASK